MKIDASGAEDKIVEIRQRNICFHSIYKFTVYQRTLFCELELSLQTYI